MEDILGALHQPKTINEVAQALGKERHTVAKYLEGLEQAGLVQHRTIGKAKLYSKTPSALLNVLLKNSQLQTELADIFNLSGATIRIKTPELKTTWTNKPTTKECYEQIGNTCKCKTCPVELSFKDGKNHKTKVNKHNIITKPILDEHGNTIAVFEVIHT